MKRTALLLPSGFLAAGIFVVASLAWACDKPPTATGSSCASSSATAVAAATPAPAVPAAATPAPTGTAPNAPAQPGMRAYIDPETGVVGSPGPLPPLTAEEAKLLQPEVQEEPVETVLPDGSVVLDLKGRGQEYFIMQLDANGKPVVRCVEDPKAALQPMASSKPEER